MNKSILEKNVAQKNHTKRKCQFGVLLIFFSFLFVAPISYYLGESHWLYAPLVVFLGVLISESTKQVKECAEHGMSSFLSFGSHYWLITVCFLLLILSIGLYSVLPKPYPYKDGKWADFNTGAGGGAVNAFDLGFNIFSDNTVNMNSSCTFKNISLHDGEGYLKFRYNLISDDGRVPYCGIFADLSSGGTKVFDVSRFSTISFRIRSSMFAPQDTNVVLSAQTTDIAEWGTDEYPEYIIPDDEIKSQWKSVPIKFDLLTKPGWSNSPKAIIFNSRKLFRIAVVAKGTPGKHITGEIDIDDIFFR